MVGKKTNIVHGVSCRLLMMGLILKKNLIHHLRLLHRRLLVIITQDQECVLAKGWDGSLLIPALPLKVVVDG